MKVSQLYTYPIKSLRGVALPSSKASVNGLSYDRHFMLLKVLNRNNGRELKNMLVGKFPDMALFTQELRDEAKTLVVTFNPPNDAEKQTIEMSSQPDTGHLTALDIVLHSSPTKAYDMGAKYNDWFSSCFGYEVVLAYIGPYHRPVLGNLAPNGQAQSSWTSAITSRVLGKSSTESPEILTFADIAAYLVVTEESLDDVSSRLPDGASMDMTKFRPNIVLSGSAEAWDEDYWGALSVNGSELEITASCARCQSIDVDYSTGRYSTDDKTQVLKKLMKDRRIDKGMKYSPVFGRYCFLPPGSTSSFKISLGDEVQVTRKNQELTVFQWPGLGTKV